MDNPINIGEIRHQLCLQFSDPNLPEADTKQRFEETMSKIDQAKRKVLLPQLCEDRAEHIALRLGIRLSKNTPDGPANALGAGGFGVVYMTEDEFRARDHQALKLLQPHYLSQPEIVKRFEYEYWVLKHFRHDALPDLMRYGDVKGQHFYLMEYCGVSLNASSDAKLKLLKHGVNAVISFAAELFDLLALVHSEQAMDGKFVAHRDIKPLNILIHELPGNKIVPKLIDFGIAQVRHDEKEELTPSNKAVERSDKYMDPDFLEYGHTNACPGDVYSLGKVVRDDLLKQLETTGDEVELAQRAALTAIVEACCAPWPKPGGKPRPSAADVRDALHGLLKPTLPLPAPKPRWAVWLLTPIWLRTRGTLFFGPLFFCLLVWAAVTTWLASSYMSLAHGMSAKISWLDAKSSFDAKQNDTNAAAFLRACKKWKGYAELKNEEGYQLGVAYQSLGNYYQADQRREEAEPCFELAIGIFESVVKQHPEVVEYRFALARACGCLGDSLLWKNLADSEKLYDRSFRIRQACVTDRQKDPSARYQRALAFSNNARLYFYLPKRIDDARVTWGETIHDLEFVYRWKDTPKNLEEEAAEALASSILDHRCGAIAAEMEEHKGIKGEATKAANLLMQVQDQKHYTPKPSPLKLLEDRNSSYGRLLRFEEKMWSYLLKDPADKKSGNSLLEEIKTFMTTCPEKKRWTKSLYVEVVTRMRRPDEATVQQAFEYTNELAQVNDFFLREQKERFFRNHRPASRDGK